MKCRKMSPVHVTLKAGVKHNPGITKKMTKARASVCLILAMALIIFQRAFPCEKIGITVRLQNVCVSVGAGFPTWSLLESPFIPGFIYIENNPFAIRTFRTWTHVKLLRGILRAFFKDATIFKPCTRQFVLHSFCFHLFSKSDDDPIMTECSI